MDKKSENLTFAVLAIVLGLLFIIFKSAIISLTMTVFGILLIVSGVLDLMKKAVTGGVIKVVAGVVLIVFGWTLLTAALYVLAALLLIFGIIELYNTIRRRKSLGKTEFTMYAVEYALFIAIGVCLLFNRWAQSIGSLSFRVSCSSWTACSRLRNSCGRRPLPREPRGYLRTSAPKAPSL